MKNKLLILLFLTTTSVTQAQIDSDKFIELIGQEPSVEINLGAMMLGLLSSATDKQEQGISQILSSLKAINVTVFEIGKLKDVKPLRVEINNFAKSKVAQGYEKLAVVKEDDSLVYVLAKMNNKELNNLSILALEDDDELVIVDIRGAIKMSQIGDLMKHFDVDLELNTLNLNK